MNVKGIEYRLRRLQGSAVGRHVETIPPYFDLSILQFIHIEARRRRYEFVADAFIVRHVF